MAPVRRLKKAVSLQDIKAEEELQELGLVRNPRLSVMPIPEEAYQLILKMGGE